MALGQTAIVTTVRPYGWATAILLAVALTVLGACTLRDGEGARYIGRVVSVDQHEICVGPSSSSDTTTCGDLPDNPPPLPAVGDCVGLFPRSGGENGHITWSTDSLRREYDDDRCTP